MKVYSKKFKEEVVSASDSTRFTLAETAEKYGVSLGALNHWRSDRKHLGYQSSSRGHAFFEDKPTRTSSSDIVTRLRKLDQKIQSRDHDIRQALLLIESTIKSVNLLVMEIKIDRQNARKNPK